MQNQKKIEMTLVPEADLIERVLKAAAGRISFEDTLKLTELRHDLLRMKHLPAPILEVLA